MGLHFTLLKDIILISIITIGSVPTLYLLWNQSWLCWHRRCTIYTELKQPWKTRSCGCQEKSKRKAAKTERGGYMEIQFPIVGSMCGIFNYIWWIFVMINVGKFIPYMDPMSIFMGQFMYVWIVDFCLKSFFWFFVMDHGYPGHRNVDWIDEMMRVA